MKSGIHIPGLPTSPEPKGLDKLLLSIHHPNVVRTGITTTTDGAWALLIVIKQGTALPIKAVEEKRNGYPVIYQYESGKLLVARPAYPAFGE